MKRFLAVDLGAECGRVMAGSVDGAGLTLEPLHRFANTPVRLPAGLYWDTLRLWHEIQTGLAVAGRQKGYAADGVGVDAWGVDFVCSAPMGPVDNPRHYATHAITACSADLRHLPKERIYAETGSVHADQHVSTVCPEALRFGGAGFGAVVVFMPDLFAYFLSGLLPSRQSPRLAVHNPSRELGDRC
jgi:hypothetical protein